MSKSVLNILRNTGKNGALDAKNFVVFFLKVLCDASSRLILFGTWMLTYNSGIFSTKLIVAYYYGMMLLLIMVNIGFGLSEQIISLRNMIGTNIETLKNILNYERLCLSDCLPVSK